MINSKVVIFCFGVHNYNDVYVSPACLCHYCNGVQGVYNNSVSAVYMIMPNTNMDSCYCWGLKNAEYRELVIDVPLQEQLT